MMPRLSSRRMWLLLAGGVAGWIVLVVYCARRDWPATQLALILPPIFGAFVLYALRLRSEIVLLFAGFSFISNAIAPPFFFLQKQFYSYGGDFGAVKAFSFGVGELMRMYIPVLVFTVALLVFVTIGIKWGRRWFPWPASPRPARPQKPTRRALYDYAIVLFLLLVAIPQSLIMYSMRVGITGMVSPVLPLRLTGLLYYSRSFAYPILLFVLYAVSRRHAATALVILFYASVASLAGSSRFVLVASAASVVVFAIMDGRRIRFLVTTALVILAFMLTSRSRHFIYAEDLPFTEYVVKSIQGGGEATAITVGDFIGKIAMRVAGPQDLVLAYQYDIEDRPTAIWRWFTDQETVPNLTYAFYGITFEAGSGFGVGIGMVAWMIVISRRGYLVLVFLAAVIAALLTLGDIAVRGVRSVDKFNISAGADPLAFFLVYGLYASAAIRWYYELVAVAIGGILLIRLVARMRHRRQPASAPRTRALPVNG